MCGQVKKIEAIDKYNVHHDLYLHLWSIKLLQKKPLELPELFAKSALQVFILTSILLLAVLKTQDGC